MRDAPLPQMADTLRTQVETPRPAPGWLTQLLVGVALLASIFVAFLAYYFLAGLSAPPTTTEPQPVRDTPGEIRTYGSLPDLFAGRTESKVALHDIPIRPGVVGLGSLSDLRGEIAIVRGIKWLAYPALGNRITIEGNPTKNESAGFLAVADVDQWQSETLTTAVPFHQLAPLIEEHARRGGLDPARPFPVMIDGTFTAIALNTANGPAIGSEPPTKERVKETAVRATLPSAEGTIVGFFATSGGDRLIHTGERFHLHIVLPTAAQVGHLDSAQIEAGAMLRLPGKG